MTSPLKKPIVISWDPEEKRQVPLGISRVYILYALAKQSQSLGVRRPWWSGLGGEKRGWKNKMTRRTIDHADDV